MREEDSSWFSKWEEELPSPEELTPLTQTLITRDLAVAFDIQTPNSNNFNSFHLHHQPQSHHIHHQRQRSSPAPQLAPFHQSGSGDFDSSSAELGGGGGGGGGATSGGGSDEPARTLKRPRLVWTPQLHKRFVEAVAHLGIKNAVPKTIMQLMSVDGLTRENVASHLQKYRLYLKRVQGLNNGGSNGAGCGGGGGGLVGLGDPVTDHLFASSPVPAHFLHPQGGGGYVPPPAAAAALHHHQQQQVAAMMTGGQYHHHHRQMGHFGSHTSGGGQFEHTFLSRQAQMGAGLGGHGMLQNSVSGYIEDVESGTATNGRKVLTLFPTGDD